MTTTTADFDFTPEHRAYFDELCLAVKDAQDNPDHWDQSDWHCNTSHCIGGFGDMRRNGLSPQDAWPQTVTVFAIDYPYWGLEAEIFSGSNSLTTILECLEFIRVHGFEYNREGYNIDGYDKDGYDEDGYDCFERDKNGFDSNGYDFHGYDYEGYDHEGYDHEGYDKDGYDRSGHDKEAATVLLSLSIEHLGLEFEVRSSGIEPYPNTMGSVWLAEKCLDDETNNHGFVGSWECFIELWPRFSDVTPPPTWHEVNEGVREYPYEWRHIADVSGIEAS